MLEIVLLGCRKKLLSGYLPLRGRVGGLKVPPNSAKLFIGQNDFPLGGGGYPPISLRKKYAKKTAIFGPKIFLGIFLAIFR